MIFSVVPLFFPSTLYRNQSEPNDFPAIAHKMFIKILRESRDCYKINKEEVEHSVLI